MGDLSLKLPIIPHAHQIIRVFLYPSHSPLKFTMPAYSKLKITGNQEYIHLHK